MNDTQASQATTKITMAAAILVLTVCTSLALCENAQAMAIEKMNLENAKGSCKVTTSLGFNWGSDEITNAFGIYTPAGTLATKPITKVKSTNPKVVKAQAENHHLSLTFKKVGKATVSYKYKGKTHNVTFTVYKYQNPLKSFTIGSKQFASKFEKGAIGLCGPCYGGKVRVTPAKNWKLTKIQALSNSIRTISNGATIAKTDEPLVLLTLKNKKTNVVQRVTLSMGMDYWG